METPKPLNKVIYDRAKALGVKTIILRFSGGSDEGYLTIDLNPWPEKGGNDLERDIEDWAWDVYCYSVAGDGSDYGDNITYDLAKNKVSCSEWFMARTEGETKSGKLTFEEASDQE